MGHVFDSSAFAKLDNPRRRELLPPESILEGLGVTAGSRLADFGCGTGYLALPAATVVGTEGHVFAMDLQERMLVEARRRSEAAGLCNIAWILNPEGHIPLPGAFVDRLAMVAVFHEIRQREEVLAEACRVLQPRGRIGIVDWTPGFTEMGPQEDHRVPAETAAGLLEAAGFSHISIGAVSAGFYIVTGEKPA
ncbi:conserved hypothetical protein [Heliomicrobium modesticaldum Ice1]|uniref:Methyltransferase domain-containing protein n=1 Tax=Heliobacterium modesticaldum (strain ATCC 51547 / Ice1) TaxID=498761 RepID=B0TEP0_HELMI|nr:methyltransferase domain-containing protein [Heliomicrobium modesticaldum]ABZ84292.1 conserved hypothetical protein [Heliomicrobium modesticaldum Ice1]